MAEKGVEEQVLAMERLPAFGFLRILLVAKEVRKP